MIGMKGGISIEPLSGSVSYGGGGGALYLKRNVTRDKDQTPSHIVLSISCIPKLSLSKYTRSLGASARNLCPLLLKSYPNHMVESDG